MKKSVHLKNYFVAIFIVFFQFAFADNGPESYLVFDNVADKVYALVTIDSLINGAQVANIDDNGNGVGYSIALQPKVTVPGLLKASSHEAYAVFKIGFYNKGNDAPVNLQTVNATALDIDGNATLKEFAEINMDGGSATYMSTTPDISVISILSGLKYRADNILGIERDGIDTSAFANMFTATKSNVNTFKIKYGATSLQTGSTTRQFSLYMDGFQYPDQIKLPVKLIDFTARYTKPNVVLEWSTAQEHNFSHFIVEHSTDGQDFTQTALVFGVGESDSKINYSYTDKDMKGRGGIIYYRLKEVDIDGAFKYSNIRIVRLDEENTSITLTTFPNPATTDLRITLPSPWQNKQVHIDLYSASGQLMNTFNISKSSQTESISVAPLQRGIYFIQARCGEDIAKQQFLKN
jgi:hypothetical protein